MNSASRVYGCRICNFPGRFVCRRCMGYLPLDQRERLASILRLGARSISDRQALERVLEFARCEYEFDLAFGMRRERRNAG